MENSMKKPKAWRVKYVINPKFQYFMIGFALFQSLVTIAAIVAMNTYSFKRFNAMGVEAGIPTNHIYFQFLRDQKAFFNDAMLVTSVVVGLAIIASVTVISHRIAGPIYRLTKHMQGIIEGEEVRDIQFRKDDFFQEIPESFNMMVLKIKEEKNKAA